MFCSGIDTFWIPYYNGDILLILFMYRSCNNVGTFVNSQSNIFDWVNEAKNIYSTGCEIIKYPRIAHNGFSNTDKAIVFKKRGFKQYC